MFSSSVFNVLPKRHPPKGGRKKTLSRYSEQLPWLRCINPLPLGKYPKVKEEKIKMNALKIVITAMTLMALIGLVSAGSGNNVPTNADLSGCSNPPWIKAKFELNDDGDDWIELFNNEAIQNDIGDWILAHKNGAYTAYKIPQGTVINAKSFLIFYRNKTSINLNESEGDIMLYNPECNTYGLGEIQFHTLQQHLGSVPNKHLTVEERVGTMGYPRKPQP